MCWELILQSGIKAYVKAVPIFFHTYWWVNDNIEKLEEAEKLIIKTISDPEIQLARIDGILAIDGTKYLGKKINTPTLVCCAKTISLH